MLKRLLAALTVVLVFSVLVVPLSANAALFDGAKDQACQGASLGGSCDTSAETKVNNTLAKSLNIFSAIVGIIAVVMIMVAGVKYITSQGDSAQVNSAKNTILYASIGIVVAVLAQVITKFVIARFTQ